MSNVDIPREMLDRFDQLVDSLKDVSDEYGPQAIEAVTTALYVDALMNIFIGLTMCVICAFIFKKGYDGVIYGFNNTDPDDGSPIVFVSMLGIVFSFIVFMFSLFNMVLDKASWTMLYSPEAGVARYIIGL